MEGRIVLVNKANRLAAMEVDDNAYVVFEYFHPQTFAEGDVLTGFTEAVGHTQVRLSAQASNRIAQAGVATELPSSFSVNLLSSKMEWLKTKLVVSPWQSAASAA